ncbi:hypothetical protein [Anabaena azotica]|uniref:hypothetical protein n=1 Tax=Anabaena azotica TaxID=197653 RepID=UPI0039A61DC2
MSQSNALRQLEMILDEAVTNGSREQTSGHILLSAMNLELIPKNMVNFYELLSKAEEEAKKLSNNPKIDRYIQAIGKLHHVFIVNSIWTTKWSVFATHIESKNILTILDALANDFHRQNPKILLEKDFLKDLNAEFENILEEVLSTDLSKELKVYLISRIQDILSAIRRYSIDGTE